MDFLMVQKINIINQRFLDVTRRYNRSEIFVG